MAVAMVDQEGKVRYEVEIADALEELVAAARDNHSLRITKALMRLGGVGFEFRDKKLL